MKTMNFTGSVPENQLLTNVLDFFYIIPEFSKTKIEIIVGINQKTSFFGKL